ncbi:phosphatidylinositol glycan class L [Rhizodiscina lignyota]|uniref:N-acetylglucosaminylphosphatidylinositol deacetylase n=1 Tax=Rhizodiscina lignyota TaxID=1504668 RepID=A0A9P4INQ9_9PEZI|nr:phosphatidylinositol glycan class L [Rhizodiscina lignyota]
MHWLSIASIPLLVFGLWLYTAQLSRGFPAIRGKRICFLIAHPDDEAMFFAPTVLALTKPELGNHVKILCLSSGDANGLGETRKKELITSGLMLGLRSSDDIFVFEDRNFPDSMSVTWNPRLISNLLTTTFAPKMASIAATSAPQTTVDIVITFDEHGISHHPNHRSLYHGATTFIKSLMHRHTGWECPIALYTLTSVNIVRKYSSVLDAPATIFNLIFRKKEQSAFPTPLLYVSGLREYVAARSAMVRGHKSQMVWFRWGWIALGRYMILNDLKKEKVL